MSFFLHIFVPQNRAIIMLSMTGGEKNMEYEKLDNLLKEVVRLQIKPNYARYS